MISITTKEAMEIVTQINSIMDQRVNIMNSDGIIVGSSDEKRIGTFHEGAYLIIKNRLERLVVTSDDTYRGSKKGTNFPIIVDGEIVGVVGISGEYDGRDKYGQIIKTMTEILLTGVMNERERQKKENIRSRFVEEWFVGEVRIINKAFIDRGNALGIDITQPRRVVGCSVYSDHKSANEDMIKKIEQGEEYLLSLLYKADASNVGCRIGSDIFCAITDRNDKEVETLFEYLEKKLYEKYGLSLAMGADNRCSNYLLIHQSYIRSKKALEACTRTHKRKMRFYEDLNMEIFSEEIPAVVKQEYIRKVFKGYTNDEIAQTVLLLETFLDEEGSITRTADKLFMHKNTLQYKLKKIEERTGYDPRSIRHSSLFYIAIYFYREIRDMMLENINYE